MRCFELCVVLLLAVTTPAGAATSQATPKGQSISALESSDESSIEQKGPAGGTPAPAGIASNCTQPPGNCQDRPATASIGGNAADFMMRLADDFKPAVAGAITRVCVWGTYRSDTPFNLGFQVRYYLD